MANEQQARTEAENIALKQELKEVLKMNAQYEAKILKLTQGQQKEE